MCETYTIPAFVSIENLEATLGTQTSTTTLFLLCQKCYQDSNQLFHSPTNSASCGAIPKACTRFCHHSPKANIVSEHLKKAVGNDTSIHPNNSVYSTCYKVHSSIIKVLHVYRIKAA